MAFFTPIAKTFRTGKVFVPNVPVNLSFVETFEAVTDSANSIWKIIYSMQSGKIVEHSFVSAKEMQTDLTLLKATIDKIA